MKTAAIRRRARRRKAAARSGGGNVVVAPDEDVDETDDDVSNGMFRCCGAGFLFGDNTEEDYQEIRMHEKTLYEERKKSRAEREAQLRSNYRRHKQTSKASQGGNSAAEAFEVLE